jgi:hypothetical protein
MFTVPQLTVLAEVERDMEEPETLLVLVLGVLNAYILDVSEKRRPKWRRMPCTVHPTGV